MTRYTSFAGSIGRMMAIGPGQYAIENPKRVPAPVRAIFLRVPGPIEVEYDTKSGEARVVPYWERYWL